jgi:hypothetical protein
LAEEKAYQETLKKMSAALDQWVIDTNDEGRLQEDPKLVEESRKTLLVTRKNRGDKTKKNSDDE